MLDPGRQKEKAEEGKENVEDSVHWVSTGWALQTSGIETLTMQAIEPKETKCLSRLHPPTQPLHSLSKQWLSPDREATALHRAQKRLHITYRFFPIKRVNFFK